MITKLQIDENFPLTRKFFSQVKYQSTRYNISALDLIQESYLIEWKMHSKYFCSTDKKEHYFTKSLHRNLYKAVKKFRSFEPIIEKESNKFCDYKHEEIINSNIRLGPLKEFYYEDLVNSMFKELSYFDLLSAKIFRDKISYNQIRWKEIKLMNYEGIPHTKFYNAIKLLKEVIKRSLPSLLDK